MSVVFNHSTNIQTFGAADAALSVLFANEKPRSLLDVGCGTGTWLKAATKYGVEEVFGVDGVRIPAAQLHVPADKIGFQDLTLRWDLKRRFDAIFCLEVAEHLEEASAPTLIEALVTHGDLIFFSAACPGQPGQHHVNCQWLDYWQALFNSHGFVCSDQIRWKLWDNQLVEPWYRQNLFVARLDPLSAGKESRIKRVIHPDLVVLCNKSGAFSVEDHVRRVERGALKVGWYLSAPFKAVPHKIARRLGIEPKL